jgi:hypothetical protein
MSKSAATIRNESLVSAELARSILDYDPDTGILTWKSRPVLKRQDKGWNTKYAGTQAGKAHTRNYIIVGINYKAYLAHRVAWLIYTGEWPKDEIDHIDHDSSNNRIANLREADRQVNCRNMSISKRNKTGFVGVAWNKTRKSWTANIQHKGRNLYLGGYQSLGEAAMARARYENKLGYHSNHGQQNK